MLKAVTYIAIIMACSTVAFAKDKSKQLFQIEVVAADVSQRSVPTYQQGSTNTQCSATASTSECTTAENTNHINITQVSVRAIFPNNQHVLLWCQAAFRKCSNLAPGTYQVEADGDQAVRVYGYSFVTHKLMGKVKYRVAGTW